MNLTLEEYNIKEYLQNDHKNLLNINLYKELNVDKLPIDVINSMKLKKDENIELNNFNYHFFYLIKTNKEINKIFSTLNNIFEENLRKKRKTLLKNSIKKMKDKFYHISFELPYKKTYDEKYPLYFIPIDKLQKYYQENID